eukprot:3245480-Ditylum_brightwellii.AAC.1
MCIPISGDVISALPQSGVVAVVNNDMLNNKDDEADGKADEADEADDKDDEAEDKDDEADTKNKGDADICD